MRTCLYVRLATLPFCSLFPMCGQKRLLVSLPPSLPSRRKSGRSGHERQHQTDPVAASSCNTPVATVCGCLGQQMDAVTCVGRCRINCCVTLKSKIVHFGYAFESIPSGYRLVPCEVSSMSPEVRRGERSLGGTSRTKSSKQLIASKTLCYLNSSEIKSLQTFTF
jgi:hypothetical protein